MDVWERRAQTVSDSHRLKNPCISLMLLNYYLIPIKVTLPARHNLRIKTFVVAKFAGPPDPSTSSLMHPTEPWRLYYSANPNHRTLFPWAYHTEAKVGGGCRVPGDTARAWRLVRHDSTTPSRRRHGELTMRFILLPLNYRLCDRIGVDNVWI